VGKGEHTSSSIFRIKESIKSGLGSPLILASSDIFELMKVRIFILNESSQRKNRETGVSPIHRSCVIKEFILKLSANILIHA
jgi:hypothetical protein